MASSDARMVPRTVTSSPLFVRTSTWPNLCSISTRPPRQFALRWMLCSYRSSFANAAAGITISPTAIHLLIRNMVSLPQHLLQRALLLRIDCQQLFTQVRVFAVAIDVRLALCDGVIEQHEFFFVADQQRRRSFIELRLRALLQFVDGGQVCLLRLLDCVQSRSLKDALIELIGADSFIGLPREDAQACQHDDCRCDLPPLRLRVSLLGADRALDARPQHVVLPRGMHPARDARDLVPRCQPGGAGLTSARVLASHFEREGIAFHQQIVNIIATNYHDIFFHCSWSCFLVAKRIHFEFPSVMLRTWAISA